MSSKIGNRALGVCCPKCGYRKTKIDYTRRRYHQTNKRRRTCLKCKSRFYTEEKVFAEKNNSLDA